MGKMDNILKLLLGVLSVAGLLAMLVPSGLTPVQPEPVAAETTPPVQPVESTPPPVEVVVADSEEYNFKIGEPTIDGKPIVDPDALPPNEFNNPMPSEQSTAANGSPAPIASLNESSAPNGSGETAAPPL